MKTIEGGNLLLLEGGEEGDLTVLEMKERDLLLLENGGGRDGDLLRGTDGAMIW